MNLTSILACITTRFVVKLKSQFPPDFANPFFPPTGESELGSEFSLGHRLPSCQYRSSRPEGGETSPGAWTPLADY